jgi:tellurite resistance protein TerC
VVILVLIVADFVFVSKKTLANATFLTFLWIFLGLAFSIYVYIFWGKNSFYEYLTAYCVEKSLSVDNIFIFMLIFQKLNIEGEYQRKLLFLGIFSALIFRVIMILTVSGLLHSFHFMMWVFGALIFYAGVTAFRSSDGGKNFGGVILKKAATYLKISEKDHGGRFFISENGVTKITVLTVAIFCIEICDIVFAFDSVPALFSITDNRFMIYTSNAFAIIGLRSLYVVFAKFVGKLHYLKYGIALILCLIGTKMMLSNYLHFNSYVYLFAIVGILIISSIMSVIKSRGAKKFGGKK